MNRLFTIITIALLCVCPSVYYGQAIELPNPNPTYGDLFKAIEGQTSYNLVFSEDDIDTRNNLELSKTEYQLNDLLKDVQRQTDLEFKRIENSIVVTRKTTGANQNKNLILQPLRGVIHDLSTGQPLPVANIHIIEYPDLGSVADVDGNFLVNVPLGRINLAVSYIGYQTQLVPLLITTGQEQYIELDLEPSVESLEEVLIEADRDKARTNNELAYASGRGFNVIEANRYAGTLADPARMVRSFAGVMPVRDDRNDIIIRGNSPTGIQWRLDGIEIPNPNHYGGIGLTGNTTTLLNMNLIDNSDFLMGAFPSAYGNALAGVFDLHMAKVNPTKRQYRFQTGWNGFEFGAMGPFTKKKNVGTYSLTYRYSFLDAMQYLGVDFGVLPEFQDITGKFDFNLSQNTSLSLIGIWATSFIELDDRTLDLEDTLSPGQYLKTGSDFWLGGANLKHRVNDKLVFKTGISVIGNTVKTHIDTFNYETDNSNRVFQENSSETKYSWFAQADYRNGKNLTQIGARWDTYVIDYNSHSLNNSGTLDTLYNGNGELNLARLYAEREYRFTDRLRLRAGIHGQYFLFNDSWAVEPRSAIRYLFHDYQSISFAYGNHHQLQPRNTYFVNTNGVLTNKNLDFSGAHHFTLAYDVSLSENLRLKAEVYYQHLYDIPIDSDTSSTFSMLNVGADFYIPQNDSLVNEGIGRNYGVELTLERFLDKGYYYMFNGTVFKSEYQTWDNTWRSTAFDMGFTVNALGGYEYWFGQKVAIGADVKLTYAGGRPYIPTNEVASNNAGEIVLDESRAYQVKYDEYFRTDLKIFYRINYKSVYTEFAVDLQNLTNHKNTFQREYNLTTGEYETFYQQGFFPMATFRMQF